MHPREAWEKACGGGGWRTSKASMWLWCWLELSEMGQGGNGHRGEALWVLAFRS